MQNERNGVFFSYINYFRDNIMQFYNTLSNTLCNKPCLKQTLVYYVNKNTGHQPIKKKFRSTSIKQGLM